MEPEREGRKAKVEESLALEVKIVEVEAVEVVEGEEEDGLINGERGLSIQHQKRGVGGVGLHSSKFRA